MKQNMSKQIVKVAVMKKRIVLSMLAGVFLVACSQKPEATPEQKWAGYCTSIGNAARTITLDRQNGITQQEALDYANKVTDATTKGFLLAQIEEIYAFPADQLKVDKDAIQAQFKQQATDACLKTPHDPANMPDYKPF